LIHSTRRELILTHLVLRGELTLRWELALWRELSLRRELALLREISWQWLRGELSGRDIGLLLNTHGNLLQDFRRNIRVPSYCCVPLLAYCFARYYAEVTTAGDFLATKSNRTLVRETIGA
jgi:hypothetical protein